MSATASAAYGFRVCGLESGRWLGVTGAEDWPQLSCERGGRADAPELALDIDALVVRVRADIPHSELVHPLLGRVLSQLALVRGGDAMHAGAVAGSAGAWVVIGAKMAGKSTLLAALSAAGTPIVTEDVLVFSGDSAMTGPRCIDLRPDAPCPGLGVAVRPSDPRRRVPLAPIAGEHRLAGVVHLEWSRRDSTLERLDHREAIRRLLAVRSEKGYPRDPRKLMDLAALPTICLRRPRTARGLAESVALVQGVLRDQPAALPSSASTLRARSGGRNRPARSGPTTSFL
jgi:hypothetical protein